MRRLIQFVLNRIVWVSISETVDTRQVVITFTFIGSVRYSLWLNGRFETRKRPIAIMSRIGDPSPKFPDGKWPEETTHRLESMVSSISPY